MSRVRFTAITRSCGMGVSVTVSPTSERTVRCTFT